MFVLKLVQVNNKNVFKSLQYGAENLSVTGGSPSRRASNADSILCHDFTMETSMTVCHIFTDNRFRAVFTKGFRRTDIGFTFSYVVTLETEGSPSFPARSRLECLNICWGMEKCTGANYTDGTLLCEVIYSNSVVLPWYYIEIIYRTHISQASQCIRPLSQNAAIHNRNMHTCAHFCHNMLQCGMYDWHFGIRTTDLLQLYILRISRDIYIYIYYLPCKN